MRKNAMDTKYSYTKKPPATKTQTAVLLYPLPDAPSPVERLHTGTEHKFLC